MKQRFWIGGAVMAAIILLLGGCKGAYYSAWEKVGVYKRDLLKKKIEAARDDQKAAGDQFKDALTRLKEMYGFAGGSLEKTYNALQKDYEKSAARADTVHKRIKDVETVAEDLFAEWEKELQQISSSSLRSDSKAKLRETRGRYDDMHAAMKRAERSMDPVLTRFHDQVLYLKHNLNAAAIGSLQGETADIQKEISWLIEEMNASVAQSEEFIKGLK